MTWRPVKVRRPHPDCLEPARGAECCCVVLCCAVRIGTTARSHLSMPRHLTRERQRRWLAVPCRTDPLFTCESDPLKFRFLWNARNHRRCLGLLDLHDNTCACTPLGLQQISGPPAPEGTPCIEQGHALHQLVQAVSEPIRPGRLHMHVAASNGTDDSFAGLPQSARGANRTSISYPHTFLVFEVSRVFWGGICQLSPCILLEVDKDKLVFEV